MQSDIVQQLNYIAAMLEANKDKFTVPGHIPAKVKTVREAAAEITRLTEALRTAEEREKALRHHWAALDKALTDNIIETDRPHRVRWEGEWHYGPLADAYFAMTSVVRKLARQALAGAKP